MIQKLILGLLCVITFVYGSIAFSPKTNLYYFLENNLLQKDILFNNEELNENIFGFDIKNIDIHYKKNNIGKIESIRSQFDLFTNKLEISNVQVNVNNFGINFKTIRFNYNFLSPLEIDILVLFENERFKGTIDLIGHKIIFQKTKDSRYKRILAQFKQENGVYSYEY